MRAVSVDDLGRDALPAEQVGGDRGVAAMRRDDGDDPGRGVVARVGHEVAPPAASISVPGAAS